EDTGAGLDVRLAALGVSQHVREDGERNVHLLEDLDATERRVLAPLLADATVMARLSPVSWDEWGRLLLPAIWTLVMESRTDALRGVRLSSLPSLLSDHHTWWQRLHSGINVYSSEARRRQLRTWLGHWVGLSLVEAGFKVVSEPGAEPVVERGGTRIEPFRWVRDLDSGARTADDWRALGLQ